MLARRCKKKREAQKENHGVQSDCKRAVFWKFGTERGTMRKVKGKKETPQRFSLGSPWDKDLEV